MDAHDHFSALVCNLALQKVSNKKEAKEGISSTAITPGTHFMADVTLSLAFW